MVYTRPAKCVYSSTCSSENSRVCFVSFWRFLLIKTLRKTNHPGQSVLYAYQSLSNDQKNWFSVKFLTDLSLESQEKEVQQSTPFCVQTNRNIILDLPYSWSRCGCWSFYHFWSHSVSCSLSSHSQILKITSLYCMFSISSPHSNNFNFYMRWMKEKKKQMA